MTDVREIKFRALANGVEYFVETLQPNHKINGYVRRKVTIHPASDKRGYVNEHRLIFEEHLNRFLEADEIVHHKNGIRDDNRIENLEIYTGQKRHTDLRNHWVDSDKRERADRESWAHPDMAEIAKLTGNLKNSGWRSVSYCPKDGSMFLAWSPDCSLPYLCNYEGTWPNGSWWAHSSGDVWPDRPMLFKPIPEQLKENE